MTAAYYIIQIGAVEVSVTVMLLMALCPAALITVA
jgi:hypothetical protein